MKRYMMQRREMKAISASLLESKTAKIGRKILKTNSAQFSLVYFEAYMMGLKGLLIRDRYL